MSASCSLIHKIRTHLSLCASFLCCNAELIGRLILLIFLISFAYLIIEYYYRTETFCMYLLGCHPLSKSKNKNISTQVSTFIEV